MGQYFAPVVLAHNRPFIPFYPANRFIAVQTDNQQVSFGSGCRQIPYMAYMQDIKASVGKDDFFPSLANLIQPVHKLFRSNYFG
jgi:hypothetical protein